MFDQPRPQMMDSTVIGTHMQYLSAKVLSLPKPSFWALAIASVQQAGLWLLTVWSVIQTDPAIWNTQDKNMLHKWNRYIVNRMYKNEAMWSETVTEYSETKKTIRSHPWCFSNKIFAIVSS